MSDGDAGAGDTEDGGLEPHGFEPSYAQMTGVPHYYGDIVRQLLLGGVALMLLGAPFYGDSLKVELPFEVLGALAAVGLAALANPRSRMVMLGNAIIAGVGVVVFQTWALIEYDSITGIVFVLREALAIIFLFAFYFSMKTVRAFALHQIGKQEHAMEFAEKFEDDENSEEESERKAEREGRTESWIQDEQ